MMNDHHYRNVANLDYENISAHDLPSMLDDEFRNYMEIVIAQEIGGISKNYFIEHQRLAAYAYYPPLNQKDLRTLTINNITSNEVRQKLTEKVYKELQLTFEKKIISWNSIVQTTAKRYVTNAVDQAVEIIRGKLLEMISDETETRNVIVQRFVLVNNCLKLV